MLKRKTSAFVIGLFVTCGVLIAVVTIIWLGAANYFQKGRIYVTYFGESVQGLAPDSVVKYRGVDVGRIEKISVAPDLKLIQVSMKVDLEADLSKQVIAQLKSVGLTGIVFIDLDRREAGDEDLNPRLGFKAPHPVIPSRPSMTKQIMEGVEMAISKMQEVDIKGISDQIKSIEKAMAVFFNGAPTQKILLNIESATAHLDRTAHRIDAIATGGHVEEVIDEARTALKEARALLASAKKEVDGIKLAETAGVTQQMLKDLDRQTRAVSIDIRNTGENLRTASENLEVLIEKLRADPSQLLFSTPPPHVAH